MKTSGKSQQQKDLTADWKKGAGKGESVETEDATFAFPCVKDLLGRDCSSV